MSKILKITSYYKVILQLAQSTFQLRTNQRNFLFKNFEQTLSNNNRFDREAREYSSECNSAGFESIKHVSCATTIPFRGIEPDLRFQSKDRWKPASAVPNKRTRNAAATSSYFRAGHGSSNEQRKSSARVAVATTRPSTVQSFRSEKLPGC